MQLFSGCVAGHRQSWQERGIDVPPIAVNRSAERLSDPALIDQLRQLIIQPDALTIRTAGDDFLDEIEDDVLLNIALLKQMGIEIEVNDFGSGHASIMELLKLKPKRLKIDRRLVMPITTSREQRSLVRSIVDIAQTLGRPEHAKLLRHLGGDTLQGVCDRLSGACNGSVHSTADTAKRAIRLRQLRRPIFAPFRALERL